MRCRERFGVGGFLGVFSVFFSLFCFLGKVFVYLGFELWEFLSIKLWVELRVLWEGFLRVLGFGFFFVCRVVRRRFGS